MKLYCCEPHLDCEWSMMVAAHSVREAKKIAYRAFPSDEGADYIDMRVRLERHVSLPESITVAQAFDTCEGNEDWICACFGFSHDACRGCKRYEEKHAE